MGKLGYGHRENKTHELNTPIQKKKKHLEYPACHCFVSGQTWETDRKYFISADR